jgi:hypothetical protein
MASIWIEELDFSMAEQAEAMGNCGIEIGRFRGLWVVKQNGVEKEEEFPEGDGGGIMLGGQDGGVRVGGGGRKDPVENAMQGAVVFPACGGVKGAPDVATMGGWADVKVVKQKEQRGPNLG